MRLFVAVVASAHAIQLMWDYHDTIMYQIDVQSFSVFMHSVFMHIFEKCTIELFELFELF